MESAAIQPNLELKIAYEPNLDDSFDSPGEAPSVRMLVASDVPARQEEHRVRWRLYSSILTSVGGSPCRFRLYCNPKILLRYDPRQGQSY